MGAYLKNHCALAQIPDSELYDRKYAPLSYLYRAFNNLVMCKVVSERSVTLFGEHFVVLLRMLTNSFIATHEEEIFSYPKKFKAGFEMLLIILTRFPAHLLSTLPLADFSRLLLILKEGFMSVHQCICIACYDSVHAILSLCARHLILPDQSQTVKSCMEGLLQRVADGLLRGEVSNLESMAPALLGMFVCLGARAGEVLRAVISGYGSEAKRGIKEDLVNGLEKFESGDMDSKETIRRFVERLKAIIEAMKLSEEMVVA